jgi:DHA1 family bicyclomycin/chloramphenicol resistance-like MFS transporter
VSDRFGRRAPLLLGMGVYIIAAIAAAFAPDFGTLLALRFIQGLGSAGTRVITTSVVRDRFSGRAMAEVMSLTFMVFMAIPILAPALGQVLLLTGPWQVIFLFMGGLAMIVSVWTFLRLPETLAPENRRPLRPGVIAEGFALVFGNRTAFFYGLAGMFLFGALVGFVTTAQQIYVDVYGLGVWFPLAFAGMAGMMAVASFLNARIVRRLGMRRLSHGAMIAYTALAAIWVTLSTLGLLPVWAFFLCIASIMFCFGWASSNMNSLSMEPLGKVAGTASSVFGFIQSVGGALIGSFIGQHFDGTPTPTATGYLCMGLLALGCILIAERGRLFGIGKDYVPPGH